MSLLENVIAVEEWYDKRTGKPAPLSRTLSILLAIERFMEAHRVVAKEAKDSDYFSFSALLEEVELKVSTDPQWASRRNRNENERRGILIGKGKDGTRPEYWYLVPAERRSARDETSN